MNRGDDREERRAKDERIAEQYGGTWNVAPPVPLARERFIAALRGVKIGKSALEFGVEECPYCWTPAGDCFEGQPCCGECAKERGRGEKVHTFSPYTRTGSDEQG